MPASMMKQETGGRVKVSGMRSATVAAGPSPGSMPMKVPSSVPRKQYRRFSGVSATEKPRRRFSSIAGLPPEQGDGHAEPLHEHRPAEHDKEDDEADGRDRPELAAAQAADADRESDRRNEAETLHRQ